MADTVENLPYALLEATCARFNLGRLHGVALISGGLLHRVYRCTAGGGDFAIKEMVAQATNPGFKARIETSSTIEKMAVNTGIPVPEIIFLPGTSEVLAPIALRDSRPRFVRVHRWVEGGMPVAEEEFVDLDWLSETIARIHSIGVALPAQRQIATYSPIQWGRWFNNTIVPQPAWLNPLSRALEAIQQFEKLILRWQSNNRNRPVVPSHRDVTAKNILLKDSRPVIVDWDNADWIIDPLQDVFTVAIDWSLARQGKLCEDRIMSVVRTYLKCTGYAPMFDSCQIYCSDWASGILTWLAFNLDRAQHGDAQQRSLGEAEAKRMLALLLEVGDWVFGRAHRIRLGQNPTVKRNF